MRHFFNFFGLQVLTSQGGCMKRVIMVVFIVGAFALLSGCAVIDFLDGKNFDNTRDDTSQQQYSGGGHSHH
jgi:uncharacterized protein YceK